MTRLEFGGDMVQLATRIPKQLHVRMRVTAIDERKTVAEWVGEALTEHLERCTGKKRPRKATNPAEPGPDAAA